MINKGVVNLNIIYSKQYPHCSMPSERCTNMIEYDTKFSKTKYNVCTNRLSIEIGN